MGKAAGPVEGDSFGTFTADLTPQQIEDFFDAANPRPLAIAHLGTATTRIIYDLDRVPACAASIARETHVSDLGPGEQTKVQLSFVYSDGFGREAQTKIQAEPGPLDPNDPASPTAQSALGGHRRDGLQQQGQAGPAVRAVLQPDASLRDRASTASAARCSTIPPSASSPRCTPTTHGRRSSSTRGSRRPTMSTTPF